MPIVATTSVLKETLAALVARWKSVNASIGIHYRAPQGTTGPYVVIDEADERYSETWSDKDYKAVWITVDLALWGPNPLNLQTAAKTFIASIFGTPLSVTGADLLRTRLDRNQPLPGFTPEGQDSQFTHRLAISFFLQPQ